MPGLAGGSSDPPRRSIPSNTSVWQGTSSCCDPFAGRAPYRPNRESMSSGSEGHDSQDENSHHPENFLDFFDAVTNKEYVSNDGAMSQESRSSHNDVRANSNRSEAASSVKGGSHAANQDGAPPSLYVASNPLASTSTSAGINSPAGVMNTL